MSWLKRFLLWVVRVVAILVTVLGILFVLFDLTKVQEGLLVAGIIMAVAGLVVGSVAAKMGRKIKSDKVRKALKKCPKCGGAYSSQYEYTCNLNKASKSPYSGLLCVPVAITFTCSNCGKKKILGETLEIAGVRPEEEIKEVLEDKVSSYVG